MAEGLLDRCEVRRAFDRAAAAYDALAVLQRELGRRLLERLDPIRLAPATALDLGAGTGQLSRGLQRRFPRCRVVALDLSAGMLRQLRRRQGWWRRARLVQADAQCLPLAPASLDLVLSGLTLQWCDEPARVFREVRRVLRPGGLFLFTTFGPDTLRELRAAWAVVDSRPHVSPFIDMHLLGDALVEAGFQDTVMDMEMLRLTYDSPLAMMRDIKGIGAHNALRDRPRGLTGRRRFEALLRACEAHRSEGRLPATYEVVYGHAWAPEPGVRVSLPGPRR